MKKPAPKRHYAKWIRGHVARTLCGKTCEKWTMKNHRKNICAKCSAAAKKLKRDGYEFEMQGWIKEVKVAALDSFSANEGSRFNYIKSSKGGNFTIAFTATVDAEPPKIDSGLVEGSWKKKGGAA